VEEVKIGDFSQPLVERPESTAPPALAATVPTVPTTPTGPDGTSPAADKLDAAEKRLNEKAKETEEALKPKVDYEALLKREGISMEDAAKIVDDVLFQGHYMETVQISKRISVDFRTRQAKDTARTMVYLEIAKPLYENHFSEVISKHSLAAALERVGEDKFSFPGHSATRDAIEDAFQKRLEYVNNLPDPVLRLLFVKLSKFDEKVRVVLQEGAIENF